MDRPRGRRHRSTRPTSMTTCGTPVGAIYRKDFRTWFATVEALQALRKKPARNRGEVKRELAATIATVARRLGNTPTICRKCLYPSGSPGRLR